MRPSLPTIFGALGAGEALAAAVKIPGVALPFETTVLEVGAYNEAWPPEPGFNSLTKMRRRFGIILAEVGNPARGEIKIGTTIAFDSGDTFSVEATDLVDNERAIVLARLVVP